MRLWESSTGKLIAQSMRHRDDIQVAAFSHNDQHILSWSLDNTTRLWDGVSGRSIAQPIYHDDIIFGAEFSPTDQYILSWSGSILDNRYTVQLWDARTGTLMFKQQRSDPYLFEDIQLSADQKSIISARANRGILYDISWITSDQDNLSYTQRACADKLHDNEAADIYSDSADQQILRSVRRLSARTIRVVPQLQGREGEDVCDWQPPWYDSLLRYGIGWLFSD